VTIRDVLTGAGRFAVVASDAVSFMQSLPDDSVDLLVASPPYEKARTYGIKDKMVSGEAWVSWMVEFVKAAAPKVKGLIAINCEGQTRNFNYSGVPFLLFADLKRAGFNMRKPVVFHRVGIPGSGGPDWLRNDWEPVVCVSRGKIPKADPTACGHVPKWAPGGAMSYRNEDGCRKNERGYSGRNQWGGTGGTTANRKPNGERDTRARPSHRTHTKREANGEMREQGYVVPVKANPGNVLKCNVGGGQMGHAIAHRNEAPFPVELPAFFVKSFCPPGGIVCDPFVGSGTTAHAAFENGRRFVGCKTATASPPAPA
jgi:hypothetical protein